MKSLKKVGVIIGLVLSLAVGLPSTVYANEPGLILTVGDSLSEEEFLETVNTLGASGVAESNIIRVKGSNIDHYTGNGSTDESIVVSSALVEFKEEGYGVVVEILTPDMITEVEETTYQNAAVTAGGNDLHIKIANVTFPVNGRGALAGIYMVMDVMGEGVNLDDIAYAEQELELIQEIIERELDVDTETLNNLLAVLKKDVATEVQMGHTMTSQRLGELVDLRLKEFEIDLATETKEDLLAIILNFSQTEAAQDEGLINTLDMMTGDLLQKGGEAINELPDQLDETLIQGSKPSPLSNPLILSSIFIVIALILGVVLAIRIKNSNQTQDKPRKKK